MRLIGVSSWVPLNALFFVSSSNSNANTTAGIKKGLRKPRILDFFRPTPPGIDHQSSQGKVLGPVLAEIRPPRPLRASSQIMAPLQKSLLGGRGSTGCIFWATKKSFFIILIQVLEKTER
jgi:hypothetical protein